jgi:hypothetical protein
MQMPNVVGVGLSMATTASSSFLCLANLGRRFASARTVRRSVRLSPSARAQQQVKDAEAASLPPSQDGEKKAPRIGDASAAGGEQEPEPGVPRAVAEQHDAAHPHLRRVHRPGWRPTPSTRRRMDQLRPAFQNSILIEKIPSNFVKFDIIQLNFNWRMFFTVKHQKNIKNRLNLPINWTELVEIRSNSSKIR